jgi:hypothetical protein
MYKKCPRHMTREIDSSLYRHDLIPASVSTHFNILTFGT